jgi:hypothetical protein
MPDKQIMFECAEVLNEVLKAVEQNKQALRLDYTPYRIYNLYKKKLAVNQSTDQVVSETIEENPELTKKKKAIVADFVGRAGAYLSA